MSARRAFPLLGLLLLVMVSAAILNSTRTNELMLQGKPAARAPALMKPIKPAPVRPAEAPAVNARTAPLAAADARPAGRALPPLFDQLEERTFRFFWDTADPVTGLVPDRYPTRSFASIAAVGFALTAYPVGVERGYITREEGRERVLKTLRFFRNAPQGTEATGTAGYNGFFYRYLDMKTGQRVGDIELSTVDTALLLAGMLFCESYFTGPEPEEAEIRQLVEEIYGRVNWRWVQVRGAAISHGWTPESSFLEYDWRGYNEAMLVYILALGSPTYAVAPNAWNEWVREYDRLWGTLYGQTHLRFESHFGHQYSHVWIDFRGIGDPAIRKLGIDYFENSRRATYAQRAYAMANPMGWTGYGENVWGLTASDGSADLELPFAGQTRRFRTYYARGIGPHPVDDGTIAPTAAAASIAFAPEIVVPAIEEMYRRYGEQIYGKYGFYDAFNPSFDYDVPLQHGRRIPGFGWVDGDYIGIDQGPILAMIENYRTDLVWRVMRRNPHIRRGLTRAGFAGGWLDQGSTVARADSD
ncbi:MAG TPA: glucoamylase family protein [Burkholderiales bacterium]|nr:glucoamylase family protein [Burkholderiales bacterium]